MSKNTLQFVFLTEHFYRRYSNHKEILSKKNRPYLVTIVEYNGLKFAVPIRSNIRHKYSIKTIGNRGLDFSKSVIINDDSYMDSKVVYIDSAEYIILNKKLHFIRQKLKKFIKNYIKAYNNPNTDENKNILEKSSLQYFHKELKLKKN